MKTLIKTILFSVAFLPLTVLAQNNTAQSNESGFSQTGATKTTTSKSVSKTVDNTDDAHYKVSKRNKKVGKMKYEVCEGKEIEKGTRRGEIKTICKPAK